MIVHATTDQRSEALECRRANALDRCDEWQPATTHEIIEPAVDEVTALI